MGSFSLPISEIRSYIFSPTEDWPVRPKINPEQASGGFTTICTIPNIKEATAQEDKEIIFQRHSTQQQLISQHIKSYISTLHTSLPTPNSRNLKEAIWVYQTSQQSLLLGGKKVSWGRVRPLPVMSCNQNKRSVAPPPTPPPTPD